MYVLWNKLKRPQPILKGLSKPFSNLQANIAKARSQLMKAQLDFTGDIMNVLEIEEVKSCTLNIMYWHDLDEQLLRQNTNINWLKLGDNNTTYFHATIKVKCNASSLILLYKEDGTQIHTHDDIVREILKFMEA